VAPPRASGAKSAEAHLALTKDMADYPLRIRPWANARGLLRRRTKDELNYFIN